MNADTFWSFASGILVLAILYLLVKPDSNGATAVKDLGNALVSLVRASTA